MNKTGQRGLLTLKAPGGTRRPTLLIVCPHIPSTPTLQNFVSCFMWLFPFNSKLSGLTLQFYRILLQEIAKCNMVLQLL